ncbi:MAG: hypothetical protein IKN07_08430 [Lachnospiraceae bacterium]|nr:hypothetical protein [Lachnospiraceae bacterium]
MKSATDLKKHLIFFGTAALAAGLWFAPVAEAQAAVYETDVVVDLTPDGGGETSDPDQPTERTVNVNLTENYNMDFDLYEEGFNNRYFFYSNIGNGGMTSDAVVLDIPSNLQYTMEKDAVPIVFNTGTAVQSLGAYVLTITVDETDGLNVTHYIATFRFRIMEAAAQVTENPTTTTGTTDGTPDVSLEGTELEGRRYEDLTPEEQAALKTVFGSGDGSEEELLNPDGTINQEMLEALMNESMEEMGEIDDIYVSDGISDATGMASALDPVTGYYKHILRSGQIFYTDVPNGCVTKLAVSVHSDEGVDFIVYKDGVLYEAEDKSLFDEAGTYMLIPTSSDVVFLDAYQEEKPVLSFRIMDNAANDLSLVRAPDGFRIQMVYKDDIPAVTATNLGPQSVLLREDGEYLIEFTNGEFTLDMRYTLDRVKPRFYVQTQKNRADIGYLSQDVTSTIVYLNEQPYETGTDIVYELTDTGKYWLYVFDEAGNMSAQEFYVRYGFNKGAAIAVLLLVAFIAGLFIYLRYLNTHVKVR